jgi:parallel beta-helix repeat protein
MKHTMSHIMAFAAVSALAAAQARAQGALDPPGAPAPTMKSLSQIEPRTPIGELPVTLSASGSYYLTGNLTGGSGSNGITVEADDVTIDLGGFVLAGVSGSLDGILVSGSHVNLVIKNGTIRAWGGDGVNGTAASAGGCFNVRALSNGKAGMRTGERSTIKDCVATGNLEGGIRGGYHSLISGCVASGNKEAGIAGDGGATVHDCLAMNNIDGAPGIVCADVSVIEGSTCRDNDGNGFFAGAGSVIERCTATANNGNGVQTSLSSTVKACAAKNNSGAGVSVDHGSTVRDCVSRQNAVSGIELTDRCLILDNNCSENESDGIHVIGSANRIEGNHMTNNAIGLKVLAAGNVIVRNTALGNSPGFEVTGTQMIGPIETDLDAASSPWANFTDSID